MPYRKTVETITMQFFSCFDSLFYYFNEFRNVVLDSKLTIGAKITILPLEYNCALCKKISNYNMII